MRRFKSWPLIQIILCMLLAGIAPRAIADASADAAARTEMIDSVRLGLATEMSRFVHQEGVQQLERAMSAWSAQNPPASGDIRDHKALHDAFARRRASLLLRRHVSSVVENYIAQIQGHSGIGTGAGSPRAANDNVAPSMTGVFAFVRQTLFQALVADDHVAGFLAVLENHQAETGRASNDESFDPQTDSSAGGSMKIPALFQRGQEINRDPRALKVTDFVPGEFQIDWSVLKDLEKDRPSALHRGASSILAAGKEFAVQSTLFNTATGLVQVAQLGIDYSKDPLALDKFLKSLEDPAANVGFAAFMATNHKLTRLLSGVMTGKISRNLLPYIGMSAGLIASSLVSDLYNDKDLHKCLRSSFHNLNSCDVAFENWVAGSKIDHYAPSIISLCAATVFSGIVKEVPTEGTRAVRVVMRGMRLMPRAAASVVEASSFEAGPLGVLTANLLFLGTSQILSTKLDPWMDRFAKGDFDLYAFLKRNTLLGAQTDGLHLLFFGSIKMPKLEDITTLRASIKNLEETYQNAEANHWQEIDANLCTKSSTSFVKYEINKKGVADCIWKSSLADSITRYSTVNQEWRKTLLSTPLATESSWTEALFNFTTLYVGSNAVYRYYIESLHARARGETSYQGKAIDVSESALTQVLQDAVKIKPIKERTDEERDALDGLYPYHFNAVATPELLDYIVASMLCGPRAEDKPSLIQYVTSMSWVHHAPFISFMYKDVPTPTSPLVNTPAGSAFRFNPPKITTLTSNLCSIGPVRSASSSRRKGDGGSVAPANLFTDIWPSPAVLAPPYRPGKTYPGILSVIENNLRPDLLAASEAASGMNNWWDAKITPASRAAWDGFEVGYKLFLKREFYPTLVSRHMRVSGFCYGRKESSTGQESYDAHERISCGVYHSMELELREYLTILRGLYLSSLAPSQRAQADHDFTALAHQVIDVFRANSSPEVIENSFDLESANAPFAAIADLLNAGINRDPKDVRLASAVSAIKAIQSIISERAEFGKMMTILDFDNQSADGEPPESSKATDIRGRIGGGG